MRSALARNSLPSLSTDDERIAKVPSKPRQVALAEPGTQWQRGNWRAQGTDCQKKRFRQEVSAPSRNSGASRGDTREESEIFVDRGGSFAADRRRRIGTRYE